MESKNYRMKLTAGILGLVLVLSVMVGSIAFQFGQATARDRVVELQTQLDAYEDDSVALREQRDRARADAFECMRSLDVAVHEMHEKGDVLASVANAVENGNEADIERALSWVEQWSAQRDDATARVDARAEECFSER